MTNAAESACLVVTGWHRTDPHAHRADVHLANLPQSGMTKAKVVAGVPGQFNKGRFGGRQHGDLAEYAITANTLPDCRRYPQ